jgi:hypothetical protein
MAIDTDELAADPGPGDPPAAPVDSGPAVAVIAGSTDANVDEDAEARSPVRLAMAVGFPVLGAAMMVGGVFTGISPRPVAAVAGLLGVLLALGVHRIRRGPLVANLFVALGLFAIGLVVLLPGVGDILHVSGLASSAVRGRSLLRPPVEFLAGWRAIVGWLMACVGFAAAWLALDLDRPSLGLLLPLPVAAIAGISVPKGSQIVSGLAVLVLFAIGLGLLSSEQSGGADGTRPSAAYEMRKALKALPLLAVLTVGLYLLATHADFLFPKSLIDPAQQPQRPKTVPLSKVQDRVLFTVTSPNNLKGPWRIGGLDVYQGNAWRLPPFAANRLDKVKSSGVVDPTLPIGPAATFKVAGLGGAVLPGLPNTVAVQAQGPELSYDARNGNIRLANGQVTPGLTYTVFQAPKPKIDELKAINDTEFPKIDPVIRRYALAIPPMPPAVSSLIDQAPKTSRFDTFQFLFSWTLKNITAKGAGAPVDISPDRVADLVGGSKTGSPYEIVATQAMLARWIGIPSRIGYGFDGGTPAGNALEVRPGNGASFVEVYFPGKKWIPVIGIPERAEPTVGSDPSLQKKDASIKPSNDIAVQLYLPTFTPPASVLGKQIALGVLAAIPVLLFLYLLYLLYPGLKKARLRSQRRAAALQAGTRARVGLAYAEWRDYATDFGFFYPTDTPLMFLDRFIDDEEHNELAWLVTRTIWGDLQDSADPNLASVAEELSRALRRRLASAQPGTVRIVAAVSRLSLRDPYAPETDLTPKRQSRKERSNEAIPVG